MRPIDADVLKEILGKYHILMKQCHGLIPTDMAVESCMVFLDEVPTLEIEPIRRGKWIIEERPFSIWIGMKYICEETRKTYTCDQCHSGFAGLDDINYCPHCGAYMRLNDEIETK